jgi:hypothetical protein
MAVRGIIDRIDRHEPTGELMVLDYKTGARAKLPAEAHLARCSARGPEGAVQEWSLCQGDKGKLMRWGDLQLPLYVLAVRELFEVAEDTPLRCGFFNLPRSKAGSGIAVWEGLGDALLASAERCAAGVIESVRGNVFWPPSGDVPERYDEFGGMLFGDPAASVDAGHLAEILDAGGAGR